MKNWFRKIYLKIWRWAHSKWSAWAIFLCAFADACFLPLPTLLFFVGITLLNLNQAYRYFILATVGTFAGALIGYMTGHFAWLKSSGEFTALAQFFIDNIPGFSASAYSTIQGYYVQWDFWILFLASFVPVPYKIFAISSGVFDINLIIFSIATLISRGLKYYFLALLIIKLGPGVKKLLQYNLKPIAFVATGVVAIVFIVIKIF
jgi:membrane protein YqaA with SNARE-associated domain